MKKILFLIASFTITACFAQDITIVPGTEFKVDDGSVYNYYIGNDATGVYIKRTSTKGKGIYQLIQKLDPKTLAVIYSKGFESERLENISYCFLKEDKIFIFSQKFDKAEKSKYFLMRQFSAATGDMIGDVKQVASTTCDPFYANNLHFNVSFSPDGKKFLVLDVNPNNKETAPVNIYETSTLKKISTKNIISAYKNSTISSFNYRIDNSGALFYLFYYMKDFDTKTNGLAVANVQPEIVQAIITPLDLGKFELLNGTFQFVNNSLAFCGIFKDEEKVTKQEEKGIGVYSFFIDAKTNDITSKGFDYFSKDVKEKLTYRDGLIQESPAEKFYSFEEIFTVGESVYLIESHSYAISGNSYTSYERELIVSKFNKTGKMEWMKIIPKFTANDMNNFNYVVRNNKVYLFYAEHPKNIERTTVDTYEPKKYVEIKNYNGSVLVCTTIDEKGNLNRSEVLRNIGWCYDPQSTNILLDKDNALLLRMINRGSERYDKVILK
jgi:hypothetical protein